MRCLPHTRVTSFIHSCEDWRGLCVCLPGTTDGSLSGTETILNVELYVLSLNLAVVITSGNVCWQCSRGQLDTDGPTVQEKVWKKRGQKSPSKGKFSTTDSCHQLAFVYFYLQEKDLSWPAKPELDKLSGLKCHYNRKGFRSPHSAIFTSFSLLFSKYFHYTVGTPKSLWLLWYLCHLPNTWGMMINLLGVHFQHHDHLSR